jgi:hypothetical protein
MKKVVSLVLTLVMVLAAVSALAAAPKNVSEIQGLPEFPADIPVKVMHVKTSGTTTSVTLNIPMSWMAVVRNWDYQSLEFDEAGTASYSIAGQKCQPGFGVWGWGNGGGTAAPYYDTNLSRIEETYVYAGKEDWQYKDEWRNDWGNYHQKLYYVETAKSYDATDEYPDGYTVLNILSMGTHGGTYDRTNVGSGASEKDNVYAYHGATTSGVDIKVNQYGYLQAAAVEVTGANFLNNEKAPVKSTVTWKVRNITSYNPKYDTYKVTKLAYIAAITEEFEDGSSITADFAHNGKLLRVK